MIKKRGDLFSTTAPALGHGVNVCGKMGAGIAKTFKGKFPKNYEAYKTNCELKFLRAGETFMHVEEGMFIFNIASQDKPGAHATYGWLFTAALDAAALATDAGLDRIAIPMIGCGIGGLEWPGVESLLRAVEIIVPNFEWEVWKL